MTEEECEAKAKELFGDEMCRNEQMQRRRWRRELWSVHRRGIAYREHLQAARVLRAQQRAQHKTLGYNPAKLPGAAPAPAR